VRVGDQAVAFLGAKGAGKSTMAAFLRNRRHVLVSDELLVMRLDGEGAPQLSAGPSQIRLWQDALDYLDTDPTHTHRRPVRAGVPKFYCDVPRDDDTQASLRRIYILGSGEGIDLSPVAPSQAFFSVLPHLYVCRFGSTILQGAGPANAFALLGQLVRTVPVLTLARRPALEELPLVAEIIEQDLCNDSF
jgi:hypothetical protein